MGVVLSSNNVPKSCFWIQLLIDARFEFLRIEELCHNSVAIEYPPFQGIDCL